MTKVSEALRKIKHTLLVPAAEYVPAIPDAVDLVERAVPLTRSSDAQPRVCPVGRHCP